MFRNPPPFADAILDSLSEGIVTIDTAGTIQRTNGAMERIFGYTAEELVGTNVRVLMPEPYASHHDSFIDHYLQTGQAWILGVGRDIEGQRKDGERFPLHIALSEFQHEGQRYFVGRLHDLTQNGGSNRLPTTDLPHPSATTEPDDEQGIRLYASALERLQTLAARPDLSFADKALGLLELGRTTLGLSHGLLARRDDDGLRVEQAAPEEAAPAPGNRLPIDSGPWRRILDEGQATAAAESEGDTPRLLGAPLFVGGRTWGVLAFTGEEARRFSKAERRLVTLFSQWLSGECEREERLAEVRQQRARLKEAQRIGQMGDWSLEPDSGALHWSEEIFRIFGLTPDSFTPSHTDFYERVHPDDVRLVYDSEQRALAGEGRHSVAHRICLPDGSVRWVQEEGEAEFDADGRAVRLAGTVQDITELREAEEAMRETADRLRVSQRFANVGTWEWDIRNGDLYWSERIPVLFGYNEGELETSYDNFLQAVHPGDRERVVQAVEDCVRRGADYRIDHRVLWPDGSVRWLHESGDVIRNDDGEAEKMLGVVWDITHHRAMEEKLTERQQLLDLLRHGLSHFIATGEYQAAEDYLLDGLVRLTGSRLGFTAAVSYTGDQLQVHGHSTMVQEGVDGARPQLLARDFPFPPPAADCQELLEQGEPLRWNAGDELPDPANFPDAFPAIDNLLVIPVFYGGEMLALYGLANQPEGFGADLPPFLEPFNATFSTLIHAQRAAEQQARIQEELERAKEHAEQANQAKSEFLSRMSHELRTPMNAILGFAQILQGEDLDSVQLESVDEIMKAGRHLLELINEVLDLAKIESGGLRLSLESVNLLDVYYECLTLLDPMVRNRGIHIHSDEAALSRTQVWADRTRLKQVLLNYLSNAVKYNREGGEVWVEVQPAADSLLRIAVADTGPGIAPEHQELLFQAFTRLEEHLHEVDGTGIGLVITKRLVELMGGEVGF
ncbi:MAG TPA: PAS domain-containing protein, partial [Gammaproteobacteria bacterium]|nr:PAS domain-containing protein [Gammaproteobacteria bacterium]